jgi:predicted nucleotidyltransferase
MAELLQRVESVNARDELAYYVHEVRVFGSYIDKTKADLGDIDLVVDLRWRNVPGRHAEYPLRRAHELGKHLRTIVEQVTFGEREVELILKARNPYVSFHLPRDPVSLGAREEVVYSSGVPDD